MLLFGLVRQSSKFVVDTQFLLIPYRLGTPHNNDRQIASEECSSSGLTFSFCIHPSDSDLFPPDLFGELEFRRILLCCVWCGEFDIRLDLSFWAPIHGAG